MSKTFKELAREQNFCSDSVKDVLKRTNGKDIDFSKMQKRDLERTFKRFIKWGYGTDMGSIDYITFNKNLTGKLVLNKRLTLDFDKRIIKYKPCVSMIECKICDAMSFDKSAMKVG